MSGALGVRPVMDNDANVGALGEALHGAGRGHLPLFYMTLSTGIGGGISRSDREVYRGADSYAGEIGHTDHPARRPACLCGSAAASNACVAGCGWSVITAGRRRN